MVDVASRYKEAEPLTDKSATEVAAALGRIYKRGPITWPRLLQVDPGREIYCPVPFKLEFEKATGSAAKCVPLPTSPFFLFSNSVCSSVVDSQGKVQTVGVHLDQFKVFAINKAVNEVMVDLQDP